jgi:hypothetical protein
MRWQREALAAGERREVGGLVFVVGVANGGSDLVTGFE